MNLPLFLDPIGMEQSLGSESVNNKTSSKRKYDKISNACEQEITPLQDTCTTYDREFIDRICDVQHKQRAQQDWYQRRQALLCSVRRCGHLAYTKPFVDSLNDGTAMCIQHLLTFYRLWPELLDPLQIEALDVEYEWMQSERKRFSSSSSSCDVSTLQGRKRKIENT